MYQIDFLDIPPLKKVSGTVRVPGSKSISNRALLMAALCQQPTTITNLLLAEDTQVMLEALRQLGCQIQQTANTVTIQQGLLAALQQTSSTPDQLYLANAGTAFRSLTAVLSVLGVPVKLSGVARMHQRPIADLVSCLQQAGCQISYLEQQGFPPLQLQAKQQWTGQRKLQVKGNISSQFLTALLMALPLVADEDIELEVVGELISKPYIDITLQMLAQFGVDITQPTKQKYIIAKGAQFCSPNVFDVEPDASSASYFVGAACLAASAEPLHLIGLRRDALQGDIKFIDAVVQMGAQVQWTTAGVQIKQASLPLMAIDLDCNHIPDAAMTLAVMALFANGSTTLSNIASWRVKETDRIAAMASELRKVGATVQEGEDFIKITPPKLWKAACLATYDDHRMAMSLSLLAFNPANKTMRILNPACVSKTYPNYFEDLFSIARTEVKHIPVICIDGPTASGKGTLSVLVAKKLGFHYLDSGALYRVLALVATKQHIECEDEAALTELALNLEVSFKDSKIYLAMEDVTQTIRAEQIGVMASKIATHAKVRAALLQLQRSFQRLPGLVADGRDMGTQVFLDAKLKIFLTASAQQRAKRRFNQLKDKGISVRMDDLLADLQDRDQRDCKRPVAPLVPAVGAKLLDNSQLSIAESVLLVQQLWEEVQCI